uniref:GINS subunit domain-containing protein n=1 Tax=Fervidicoccus fontis TaxID=683846 RepID=A0A7J3ZLW7_9CREN
MRESLTLLRKAFELTSARVVVTRDILPLRLSTGEVLVASKGEKVEVPRWIAKFLEERGIAKRLTEEISIEDVLRVHYKELDRRSISELQKLPENFYWLLQEYIETLQRDLRTAPNPRLLEERRRLEGYLSDILEKRVQAIMVLATLLKSPLVEYKPRLSLEEIELLETVSESVRVWMAALKGEVE